MVIIEIHRQKPTSKRPLAQCQFWIRINGGNGKIRLSSETYTRRSSAKRAAEKLYNDMIKSGIVIKDLC